MSDDVSGPLFLVGLVALGWLVGVMVWRYHRDVYEVSGFVASLFGESARHGYNAASGFAWVPWTVLLVVSVIPDYFFPDGPLRDALMQVGIWGLLAGLVLDLTLLLFMWPRRLAPRHLRNQRGWIPEAIQRRRQKRTVGLSSGPARKQ